MFSFKNLPLDYSINMFNYEDFWKKTAFNEILWNYTSYKAYKF